MSSAKQRVVMSVHYRIGSLESAQTSLPRCAEVHYRIGSLEMNGLRQASR